MISLHLDAVASLHILIVYVTIIESNRCGSRGGRANGVFSEHVHIDLGNANRLGNKVLGKSGRSCDRLNGDFQNVIRNGVGMNQRPALSPVFIVIVRLR